MKWKMGVTGFAHIFEHMMFRGPVYDRIAASTGADANSYESDDFTAYYLSLATQDLP